MLNIAMLSKWHVHAPGYAKQIMENPSARITCVWDEDPSRGASWAQELGVDFEADIDTLLGRADVDAVCVCSPTNLHAELMEKAARAKKHIFTEKVLCFTKAEAQRVADIIERSGVKFCISFPQRTTPHARFIKQAVDEGLLGDITLVRLRNVHGQSLTDRLPAYWYDKELTGGGAMMDLGAHPMYLASWLLGKPRRFVSMFNNITPRPVEDNAVTTIEFENKAIAVIETSLVSLYNKNIIEVYGTKGAIICQAGRVEILCDSTGPVSGWTTPSKLPNALPSPLSMFISGCENGTEIPFGLKDAVALSELMEYAYRAHDGAICAEIQSTQKGE